MGSQRFLIYIAFIGITFGSFYFLTSEGMKTRLPPPTVVASVDLRHYVGTWYEIARYPNSQQKNCFATKATYEFKPDGKISILNECRKGSLDGEFKVAMGTAWVPDKTSTAKLKVQFQWPFSGDYWIIDLSDFYDYAVVGDPDREQLWILSRTPQMDPTDYEAILGRLEKMGYSLQPLIKTIQPNR